MQRSTLSNLQVQAAPDRGAGHPLTQHSTQQHHPERPLRRPHGWACCPAWHQQQRWRQRTRGGPTCSSRRSSHRSRSRSSGACAQHTAPYGHPAVAVGTACGGTAAAALHGARASTLCPLVPALVSKPCPPQPVSVSAELKTLPTSACECGRRAQNLWGLLLLGHSRTHMECTHVHQSFCAGRSRPGVGSGACPHLIGFGAFASRSKSAYPTGFSCAGLVARRSLPFLVALRSLPRCTEVLSTLTLSS